MNWDWMTWIHIKHRVLNGLNHLVSPGSVKCKLKMGDHDSEITPEAAREIKHSVKENLIVIRLQTQKKYHKKVNTQNSQKRTYNRA